MQIKPFALERYFAKYEFIVRHLLCSSDCESMSIRDLLALDAGGDAGLQDVWLGYTESSGAPALREQIAHLYTGISPDQILVHSGAEEAIFNYMHANLKAGDHIIVHWPCYQSLYEVAASIGCKVTNWVAREENGWRLSLDDLKQALRRNTRAVVVNTPHNPTGFLMPHEDFIALNALSQQKGFYLFSDEVYRFSEYSRSATLPAACDLNPLAVSLGVMSKSFGLAGLRIGWVASHDREVLSRMAAMKDYTTISSSAPSEYLATVALAHKEVLLNRTAGILSVNLKLVDEFFAHHADRFSWVRPQAGSIAFPRLLSGSIDQFCHDLVTNQGVLLLPGTLFGDKGNHFRIGFGRKNLPEALSQLEDFIAG